MSGVTVKLNLRKMWLQTRYSHWHHSSSCGIWHGTFKVGFQTDAEIFSAFSDWLIPMPNQRHFKNLSKSQSSRIYQRASETYSSTTWGALTSRRTRGLSWTRWAYLGKDGTDRTGKCPISLAANGLSPACWRDWIDSTNGFSTCL